MNFHKFGFGILTMLMVASISLAKENRTRTELCQERGGELKTEEVTRTIKYQSGEIRHRTSVETTCVCKDGLQISTEDYEHQYCPGHDQLDAAGEMRLFQYEQNGHYLSYDEIHSDRGPSYQKLKQHIQTNEISSIDELMESLSESDRFKKMTKLYTIMVTSQSTQPGKRIILHDGKLFLGISGEPENRRHKQIEVIEFDMNKANFAFRVIDFSQEKARFVDDAIAYRNSPEGKKDTSVAKCTTCHGTSARPLWNSYQFWPNAVDESYKGDYKHGRFQYLDSDPYFMNVATGKNLAVLNFKRMAHLASKGKQFDQYKYALLGTTVPCHNVEAFFPEHQLKRMIATIGTDLEGLKADTLEVTNQEYDRKVKRGKRTGYYVSPNNNDAFHTTVLEVSEARFVMEGHGESMKYWSTAGGPGGFAYSFRNNGSNYDFDGLKFELLKLVEKTDPDISQYRFSPSLYPTEAYTQRICSILKEKSLKAYQTESGSGSKK